MSKSFFAALTKSGKVFVSTGQRKIGKEIQKNKIALHNVVFYQCQQEENDGEIKIKSLQGRKTKFKPNSAQIDSLRAKCREFLRAKCREFEKHRLFGMVR